MIPRFFAAVVPTLFVALVTLYFEPTAAPLLTLVGLVAGCVVAAITRDGFAALIGGFVVAFPLTVVAVIVSARACQAGDGICE